MICLILFLQAIAGTVLGLAISVYSNTESKKANNRQAKRNGRPNQDEIDAILDKISNSGYDSLTKEEKEILFRASEQEKTYFYDLFPLPFCKYPHSQRGSAEQNNDQHLLQGTGRWTGRRSSPMEQTHSAQEGTREEVKIFAQTGSSIDWFRTRRCLRMYEQHKRKNNQHLRMSCLPLASSLNGNKELKIFIQFQLCSKNDLVLGEISIRISVKRRNCSKLLLSL